MTIKSSGSSLSMSEINAEFGLGTNLGVYRGVTWYTDAGGTGTFSATNLSFNDFYGTRKDSPQYYTVFGLHLGGTTGTGVSPPRTSNVAKTVYSTDTSSVSIATLAAARGYGPGAAGNQTKSFVSGGFTSTYSATAERTTFSTESTALVSGANLSQARQSLEATGNADKAFYCGGTSGSSAYYAIADRTTFATEVTAAVTGANLSAQKASISAVSNSLKGFFCGGLTNVPSFSYFSSIDKTTFSSETTAVITATLSSARAAGTGLSSGTASYILGGSTSSAYTNGAQKIDMSTDTISTLGVTLTSNRTGASGPSSGSKGYAASGQNSASTLSSTTDQMVYATEVIQAVASAALGTSKISPGVT